MVCAGSTVLSVGVWLFVQVEEHSKAQQAALAAKAADLAAAVADVEAHGQEQAAKAETVRRAADRVKLERHQQVCAVLQSHCAHPNFEGGDVSNNLLGPVAAVAAVCQLLCSLHGFGLGCVLA